MFRRFRVLGFRILESKAWDMEAEILNPDSLESLGSRLGV